MVSFNYMMTERLNISYASNAFNGEKRFRIVDKFRSINTLFKKFGATNRYLIIVYRDYSRHKTCSLYQYMSLGLIATYINNWILYRN